MQLQAKFDLTKNLSAQEMALFETKCRERGIKPDVQLCKLISGFAKHEVKRLQKKAATA